MLDNLIDKIRTYLGKYVNEGYFGDITIRVQFQGGKIIMMERVERQTELFK